jgi:prefoldin subunit 4
MRDIETLDERMLGLTGRAEECEKGMKELKVILYAKFGKAINLDE